MIVLSLFVSLFHYLQSSGRLYLLIEPPNEIAIFFQFTLQSISPSLPLSLPLPLSPTLNSVQPLPQMHNGGVASAAPGCHGVVAPRTAHGGGDGAADGHARDPALDHTVAAGHALVQPRRQVVEEATAAALDEHFGEGGGGAG